MPNIKLTPSLSYLGIQLLRIRKSLIINNQAFLIQRIVNILLLLICKTKFRKDAIITLIPYAIVMCATNILSSYCVTVLPLAAYMAFKKLIIVFILIIALIFSLPHKFNKVQYFCILLIVIGGVLVGGKDILMGQFIGYIAIVIYNFCQASTLEYQSYLRRQKNYHPEQVFLMNSVLSIPLYLFLMFFQNEFDGVHEYISNKVTLQFGISFGLLSIFACSSEFISCYIAMEISPFQKATVSNIKDIVLIFISVYYFKDYALSLISESGILCCLIASIAFSYTLLQKTDDQSTYGTEQISQFSQIQDDEFDFDDWNDKETIKT